jgi:hypothetical protein
LSVLAVQTYQEQVQMAPIRHGVWFQLPQLVAVAVQGMRVLALLAAQVAVVVKMAAQAALVHQAKVMLAAVLQVAMLVLVVAVQEPLAAQGQRGLVVQAALALQIASAVRQPIMLAVVEALRITLVLRAA